MSNLINNLGEIPQIGQPILRKESSPNRLPELTTRNRLPWSPRPKNAPARTPSSARIPYRSNETVEPPPSPNQFDQTKPSCVAQGSQRPAAFTDSPKSPGDPKKGNHPPTRRFRQTKPSLKQENEQAAMREHG